MAKLATQKQVSAGADQRSPVKSATAARWAFGDSRTVTSKTNRQKTKAKKKNKPLISSDANVTDARISATPAQVLVSIVRNIRTENVVKSVCKDTSEILKGM